MGGYQTRAARFVAVGLLSSTALISARAVAQTVPAVGFGYSGAGDYSTTLPGAVTGATGVAIQVTDGGAASVTTSGLVTGVSGNGVTISSAGGPMTAVIGVGGISAFGDGLNAVTAGVGNVLISGTGNINAGGNGIFAASGGGNVNITESGAITGGTGISAATTGTGAVYVSTSGAITGTTGDGIVTTSVDGLNTILVGAGGVSGAVNGVNASATGLGDVSLVIGGNVYGGTGAGILATNNSGVGSQITINSGVTVEGGTAAVSLNSTTGQIATVNNGLVLGGDGVALATNMGTGTATFQNNGVLSGAVAAANSGGDLQLTNNATMSGSVTTAAGATTELNNVGSWTNAGGSTLTTFTNTGALALGAAGSPSTMTVTGSLAFAATSSWIAQLNTKGIDNIAVGGVATIAGGALTVQIAQGVYTIGQTYTLISAAGGVTGAFTQMLLQGGHFTGTFADTAAGLTLTLGYGDLRPIAVTKNEMAVAQALYTATQTPPTGNAAILLSAIYSQSGTAPLNSLMQMNADGPTAAVNTNLATGEMFAGAIADRMAGAGAAGSPRISEDGDKSWYTGSRRPDSQPQSTDGFGVWTSGFGGVGVFSADTRTGASSQTGGSGGAALGVDLHVGDFTVGVAGGVSQGAFASGGATGGARGLHAGVYAGVTSNTFYMDASITAASYSDTETHETYAPPGLANEKEDGKFQAREGRARVEVGWRDQGPGLHVTPFASVDVAALQSNGFSETLDGTGVSGLLGLSYAPQTTLSIPSVLGIRVEDNETLDNGVVVTTTASLGWRHEFAAQRTFQTSLNVLPNAPFVVAGAQPAADSAQVKLGARARVARNVSLFASLDGDISMKYKRIGAKAGVSVNW